MTVNPCFWSLLSIDKLEFLYIPMSVGKIKVSNDGQTIQDILLFRSLLDFVHPSETDLAESDLSSFLKLKTLAGSVTRCRLLSFDSIVAYANPTSPHYLPTRDLLINNSNITWNIIDLVVYTATDNTVLAFFHNTDFNACLMNTDQSVPYMSCSSVTGNKSFDHQDALHLIQLSRTLQTPMQPSSSAMVQDDQLIPVRLFQIVDPTTQAPLFSLPPIYSQIPSFVDIIHSISKDMVLTEFKSSCFDDPIHNRNNSTNNNGGTQLMEEIPCTRHFYASKKVELFSTKKPCNFQRILIPYGNIIFESIQITPIISVKPLMQSLPSPSYSNYMTPISTASCASTTGGDSSFSTTPSGDPFSTSNRSSNDTYFMSSAIGGQPRQNYLDSSIISPTTGDAEEVDTNPSFNFTHRNSSSSVQLLKSADKEPVQPQYPAIADPINTTKPAASSLFRKFRIQNKPHQQDLEIRSENITSTEKKRKTVFHKQSSGDVSQKDGVKVCTRCRTSNSPEWRRGPDGHKTLCNACGLRYSRFRSKQWRTTPSASSAPSMSLSTTTTMPK